VAVTHFGTELARAAIPAKAFDIHPLHYGSEEQCLRMRDNDDLVHASILTDDFAQAASQAGLHARQTALQAGHPVVFVDAAGRYVEEWPNGKCFEIRLDPSQPREAHRIVLRELTSDAA
jgi:hypothetical protein